jgi:hypothetical protein
MTRSDLFDVAVGLLVWGSILGAALVAAGWLR